AGQRSPETARDPVRDHEADAEHARQLVRALADDAVGAVAVMLVEPRDEVRETVRREQQMQPAGDTHPFPGADGLLYRAPAQPRGGERRLRVSVDRVEHVVASEALDQPARALGPDVL